MEWNDNWRFELDREKPKMLTRLAECKSKTNDVFYMAKLMHKYNPEKTSEECLDRIIEWVCGANSQTYLLDEIFEKYDEKVENI